MKKSNLSEGISRSLNMRTYDYAGSSYAGSIGLNRLRRHLQIPSNPAIGIHSSGRLATKPRTRPNRPKDPMIIVYLAVTYGRAEPAPPNYHSTSHILPTRQIYRPSSRNPRL